jgi:hypothetical protein
MTMEKKVDMLRRMMPGDNTDQGILEVYLELAGQKILNRMYPYKESYEGLEVPDRYVAIQLKVANYMISKIGAEGEIQHIENGIHRNYGASDVPDPMLAEIVPFCQAIR